MTGCSISLCFCWRGNETFLIRVWKSLPSGRFKNLEGKLGRESPKRTISTCAGLGLLQMVSEPDVGRCASEDTGLPRRVDCEIPDLLECGTKHSL